MSYHQTTEESIQVLYKCVDGAHFFISGDERLPGLCVAHPHLETAYHAVGETLRVLYQEQYGEDAQFVPSVPVSAFEAWSDAADLETKNIPAEVHTPWSTGVALQAA